jgi:hypothetical protein
MDNKEQFKIIREIVDLHEYLDTLGEDRPEIKALCKAVGVDVKTLWNSIVNGAQAIQVAHPQFAIDVLNQIFKFGVTLGYKAAIEMSMNREFGIDTPNPEEKEE